MPVFADLQNLLLMMLFLAFLTETVVEMIKRYLVRTKPYEEIVELISLVVAVFFALVFRVSLFAPENNPVIFWVGVVICGLVVSRGGNYVHNWLDKLPKK
jgi:uncharacterized membrane protein YoaK (UPF0700 family)